MSHMAQFFVICIAAAMLHLAQPRKILLQDLRTLTLRHGEMTTSRRSSPVPQLKCMGGTAGCYAFVPQHVQCYNRGSDGYDIQWECKTDMDNTYRFGKIDVSCEGYEYADDPYVLAGSCGLEYSIDKVSGAQSSGYYSSYKDNRDNNYQTGLGSTFGFICVIMIIFFVYRTCFAANSSTTYPNTSTPSAPPPYEAPPPYGSDPPPYGFRPEYQQQQQPPKYQQTGQQNSASSDNGQPGFLSGILAGGLMGYLFGNNRSGYGNYYNNGYGFQNPGYQSHGFQRDWFGSPMSGASGHSSFSSSGSRTSSGFGGTKRR